ncbi:hypothetical protein ABZN20_15010 [Methylococcus sp. ANG]|uniref:hypothetical protein n=1 Tax=Methylococcus sp. ANG TaxID=3231903 RepID=UPI0034576EC1
MNAIFLRGVIIFASTALSSGSVLAEGITLTDADMDSITAGSPGSGGPQNVLGPMHWPLFPEFLKQYYLNLHGKLDNVAIAVDSKGLSTATAIAVAHGAWTAVSANADASNGMAVSSSTSVSASY